MFSFAVSRDLTDNNPILSIPNYQTGENQWQRYYSGSEIKEIWAHIELMQTPTKQALQILFLLGQRKK